MENNNFQKCKYCQKPFKRGMTFHYHISKAHKGRPHTCRICGKCFIIKPHLRMHELSVHSNQRDFQCDICKKGFHTKDGLAVHMRSHTGERPYKCDHCPKAFKTQSYLNVHSRVHSGRRPLACIFCSKEFNRTTSLSDHILTHTSEKPYWCQVCGREFVTCTQRNQHTTIHTNERPFQCEICQRRFRISTTLRLHMINVHGKYHKKIFSCKICSVKFKTMGEKLAHEGKGLRKDAQCAFCEQRFCLGNLFAVHLRRHIGEL